MTILRSAGDAIETARHNMTTTSYSYGKFSWDAPTSNGVVRVSVLDEDSPKRQVVKAIRFAKQHRCHLSRRVEYRPGTDGPHTTFEVMCNMSTDRMLYPYGKDYQEFANSRIELSDIKAYKKKFRTDRSVQPGFKKKFWYIDKFTGMVKDYPTLRKATEKARTEIGSTVAIWANFPYGEPPRIMCYAPCLGVTLA